MDITHYSDPWDYWIIDDTFSEEDFTYIQYHLKKIELNHRNRTSIHFDPQSKLYKKCISKHLEILKLFDIEYDEKIHTCDLEFAGAQPGYEHNKIHCDDGRKLLTCILYVSETGDGTRMYKSKNKNSLVKSSEWKTNRAFVFKRTDETWHDFGSSIDSIEPRLTLMMIVYKK